MGTKDPRVDAYIAKSADFAKPILTRFRKLVHATVPDVEEAMKWSVPHFTYKGMLSHMAAFKSHCAFGFWKESLVFAKESRDTRGRLGRITSLDDLPSDRTLAGYIRKAAALNDDGVKVARKPSAARKDLKIPPYFTAALAKNQQARETFGNFSYSHKKEYVEWLTEAKTDATRQKRLETAVAWLAEGKNRHWKYA